MLKLQEKHLLPNVVQETLVRDVKFIVEEFRRCVCDVVSSETEQQGLHVEEGSDLYDILHRSDLIDTIFETCSSTFRLHKYCKGHLDAIFPTSHDLPLIIRGRPVPFQYVSILSTLRQILSSGDILGLIVGEQTAPAHSHPVYHDYTSGSEFKSHPIFSKHRICLRIHLYIDEFEVVNPLGSKKSIHKLCGVYFTLGNLGSKFTTKLKHIFLCVLCRNVVLKNEHCSYGQILKPLIDDLKTLATEGISVDFNGCTIQIFGALATVSADNLGAHQLGGFTKSFSSGRVCRFCMILHGELDAHLSEEQCVLRHKDTHAYHLQALLENPDIAKSTYGVSSKCPLEDLDYFSTVDNFVPDLMHDFLEGIVPQLIKLTLKQYHRSNIVSLNEVNGKLANFTFGSNDIKSKPTQIPAKCVVDEGSLPGKATEKWCLFRILPLLISELIPVDDAYWNLFLKCRSIADYLFAPSITDDDIDHLESEILIFLDEFVKLFPNKLTPKFHFLLHYPTQIRKLGPLCHLWCMRFEGKHQYFKRIANQVCNFRNIAYSLAKRHQLRLCWEFTSDDFLEREAKAENVQSVEFVALARNVQQAIIGNVGVSVDELETEETVLSCKTLHFNTVKYAVKDCFIVDLVHTEEVPVFLKISNIFNFRSKWLLYGNIYVCNAFDINKHAYEVESIDVWCTIEAGREIDYHALDMYTVRGRNLITLHHKPCISM